MKRFDKKIRVGILGCGAIGSRIAKSFQKELRSFCELTALNDIDPQKAMDLARKLGQPRLAQENVNRFLQKCDLMVEATNAKDLLPILRQAIAKRKTVLVMSCGKILSTPQLFKQAEDNRCQILIPSGAIAGIDALKAASLVNISSLTLTTRKPVAGFKGNEFLAARGIDLGSIKTETLIFEGNVTEAVKHFPQNINVAAVVALASLVPEKLSIRILASPEFKRNSHEVEVLGDFGRITTRTENEICPDNPKTSYLAVLSAIQAIKDFCSEVRVGT